MSRPSPSPATSMGQPHRRDISARQDLLGRELRQLFEGYTQEDVPDELLQLAARLEGAFVTKSGSGMSGSGTSGTATSGSDAPGAVGQAEASARQNAAVPAGVMETAEEGSAEQVKRKISP